MAAMVILLCVILMYFMAYTAAVQRTMRALGLLHATDSGSAGASSCRTLILLSMYLTRLNVAFLLGMIVYAITARASIWYAGAAVLALCWMGSLLIRSMPCLQLGSADMIAVLIADLERRREWYKNARDTVRLQAAEELLIHIRSVRGIQGGRGATG
jgi:hypothetical protein